MCRNCWPSALSPWITSPSTGGSSASLRSSSRRAGYAVTLLVTVVRRWDVREVAGKWAYLYRAIDQHGQVIDVLLSRRRDLAAARRFLTRALCAGTVPAEITTGRAPACPRVLGELVPSALHTVKQCANNPIGTDHGG